MSKVSKITNKFLFFKMYLSDPDGPTGEFYQTLQEEIISIRQILCKIEEEAIKSNKLLICATRAILESIMLNERSQAQRLCIVGLNLYDI